MAGRFNANGEAFTRDTNLPPIGTFSCLGWFNGATFATTWSSFFVFGTTAADPVYQAATDSVAVFALWNGSSSVKGSTASTNTWYHIGLVCEGTGAGQLKLYVNGVVDVTHAGNASVPAQKLWVGESPFTEPLDGRVAAIKIYDVALTADEVKQEMHTIRPVRYADLNAWYPIFPGSGERVLDYSGLGRNWTEAGTLSDEDPPPVSYGGSAFFTALAAAAGPIAVNVSDTLSVSLVESLALLGLVTVTDAVSLGVTESQSSLLSSAVVDTLTVGVTDSAAVAAIVTIADTLSISISDSASLVECAARCGGASAYDTTMRRRIQLLRRHRAIAYDDEIIVALLLGQLGD